MSGHTKGLLQLDAMELHGKVYPAIGVMTADVPEGEEEVFVCTEGSGGSKSWTRSVAKTTIPEDARRIAACWNATASLPVEALEAGVVEKMVELLGKFAADADKWADAVPNNYRSPCVEPGAKSINPGSETTFTVGDIRKARALLSKIGRE